ncbi:hypothetical protein ACLK1T_18000 [Escherichia coli]
MISMYQLMITIGILVLDLFLIQPSATPAWRWTPG